MSPRRYPTLADWLVSLAAAAIIMATLWLAIKDDAVPFLRWLDPRAWGF